jgi:NADH-quinone oxidoreductase subunit L
MLRNAWIIPLLPAVGFVAVLVFGKRLPRKGGELAVATVGASFVLSCIVAVQWIQRVEDHKGSAALGGFGRALLPMQGHGVSAVTTSFTWWQSSNVQFGVGIHVDGLAVMMLFMVTLVSFLVHLYSTKYMEGDRRYTHYFALLNLFTASMLLLVLADNTIELLVAWELVGFCSFALIGHWWEEKPNSDAAVKAFLTTRVGDVGLMIGIIILFFAAGSFDIGVINAKALGGDIGHTLLVVSAVCLLVGIMGKSGQFPLHTWLPDAMAGPTPVSALIHAATMVVAGVYLGARLFPVFYKGFSIANGGINAMALTGGITILIGAALAFVQRDIKKVLAYSTISQIGYMVMALGVGAWVAAVFHLFTHAFFKALLFLGAGSVSHSGSHHSFDMKDDMGGLRKYMPVTFVTFLIGSLALAGIFPLAGFWSKDEIVGAAWSSGNHLVFAAGIVTAFLTAFYMGRCLSLTFEGRYRRMPLAGAAADDHDGHGEHHLPHESPPSMTYPLIVLAFLSVVGGFVGTPFKNAFHEWIAIPGAEHGVVVPVMVVSIVLAVGGLAIGFRMYSRAPYGFGVIDPLSKLGPLYRAAVNRFYIDDLYVKGIVRPVQYGLSNFVYKVLDRKVIDGVVNGAAAGTALVGKLTRRNDERVIDGVVNGFGSITDKASYALRKIQSGNVQGYAAGLFAGVVILAAVLFLRGGI